MKYSIRETDRYTSRCAALGDVRRIDEAVDGVVWKLGNNPEVFDLVAQSPPTYIAKIDPYSWQGGSIPRLAIWFQIDGSVVWLLTIKRYPDEDENQ